MLHGTVRYSTANACNGHVHKLCALCGHSQTYSGLHECCKHLTPTDVQIAHACLDQLSNDWKWQVAALWWTWHGWDYSCCACAIIQDSVCKSNRGFPNFTRGQAILRGNVGPMAGIGPRLGVAGPSSVNSGSFARQSTTTVQVSCYLYRRSIVVTKLWEGGVR